MNVFTEISVYYLLAAFCEGTHTDVEILTEHTWRFRSTENSQRITNQHLEQERDSGKNNAFFN